MESAVAHSLLGMLADQAPGCEILADVSFDLMATMNLPGLEAVEVDDEPHFDSLVSAAQLPVLMDFWVDRCGPCKMIAPELQRVADNSVLGRTGS